jgi:hypothetical protein
MVHPGIGGIYQIFRSKPAIVIPAVWCRNIVGRHPGAILCIAAVVFIAPVIVAAATFVTRVSFAVTTGGPFAGMWFALWDAWFVGIETRFGETAPPLVRVGDGEAVDLREGKLASVEGVGDAPALPEQPILVVLGAEHAFLKLRRVVAGDSSEAGRGAANQHAVGAEHRAVSIDANAEGGGTAWV